MLSFVKEFREFIDGYKSYIVAASIGIFTGLEYYGIDIDPIIYKLLAFAGLAAVRSAMKKIEGALENNE